MITVRRKLVFNLGRYEQAEIEFTIAGIPDDTDPEDIAVQLDLLMAPDVERAAIATTHDPGDNATSAYTWRDITNMAKEGVNA